MSIRTLLAAGGLAAVLAVIALQVGRLLADPAVLPPDDFVEYWAAGRLALAGQDPYDPALLLPLEQTAGRDTAEAVMMWNPPWTLTLAMPVGALPPRAGQLAWLAVNLAAAGAAVALLWRTYGGPAGMGWVAAGVAVTFVPTLMALKAGQVGPLLALGAAGFVAADRAGRPLLAGAAAALLAVKPHLVYLVWVGLVLDAALNRRWRPLAGGLLAGGVAAAVPVAFVPGVYADYLAAFRDHPPAEWVSLTPGTALRLAFGADRFWLQFVPPAAGLAWFAARWRRAGRGWDWADQMPAVVLVSFVTSPYGAWPFDLVLLLVPVVREAARLAAGGGPFVWLAAGGYLAANAGMAALSVADVWSVAFAWVAPLALAGYGRCPADGTPRPARTAVPA